MSQIQISLSCQNNYLLTVLPLCPMQRQSFALSASKISLNKLQNKILQLDSHSAKKSDRYASAPKSAKAFEDSLRKYDAMQSKNQKIESPLRKNLSYGQLQPQNIAKGNQKLYIVDISKKIKKVDSPFKCIQNIFENDKQQMIQQSNIVISSFKSISQKIEQSEVSSEEFDKKMKQDIKQFDQLELEVQKFLEGIKEDKRYLNKNELRKQSSEIVCEEQDIIDIVNEKDIMEAECDEKAEDNDSESSVQQFNSFNYKISSQECQKSNSLKQISSSGPSKSNSSKSIRQNKKNKKKTIKKQKRRVAIQMKKKLQSIESFVQELRGKNYQLDRKTIVDQLKKYLCERKFNKLKCELRKLL